MRAYLILPVQWCSDLHRCCTMEEEVAGEAAWVPERAPVVEAAEVVGVEEEVAEAGVAEVQAACSMEAQPEPLPVKA